MRPSLAACRGSLLLLALVLPLRLAGAEDPPAPAAPGPLKIHPEARVPARFNAQAMAALADQVADGDEAARAAAEEQLAAEGPLAAVVVHARGESAPEGEVRQRLAALEQRLLADSTATAEMLTRYADAMSTVSAGAGPMEFRSPVTWQLRARGKVFLACFLDPKHYGERLNEQLSMLTPYLDLPAAAAVYRCGGAMWERLAGATTDADEAAKCREASARCAKRAAETSRDGEEVD